MFRLGRPLRAVEGRIGNRSHQIAPCDQAPRAHVAVGTEGRPWKPRRPLAVHDPAEFGRENIVSSNA